MERQEDIRSEVEWSNYLSQFYNKGSGLLRVAGKTIGTQFANAIVREYQSPRFRRRIELGGCSYSGDALSILLNGLHSVTGGSIRFDGCGLNSRDHPHYRGDSNATLSFDDTSFGIEESTIIFNNLHLYSRITFFGCRFGTEAAIPFNNILQSHTSITHLTLYDCADIVSTAPVADLLNSNLHSLIELSLGK